MKKKLHIFMSLVLLVVVLFTALPKVYIHKLMGHNHMLEQSIGDGSEDTFTDDNTTQNCDLEKFETPVYFTVFKFIIDCSPLKQSGEQIVFSFYQESLPSFFTSFSFLRGPPAV
ncbi:MAG: hypothetical protein IPG89_02855 [Bacteroidetes bacterium]|nr:hypothetical protein [Bacteroidota bacterium]